MMDIDLLREELAVAEGLKHEIYLCSMSHKTFGIGHLITKSDPEYGQEVGEKVSPERVKEAFSHDIVVCLEDCRAVFEDFDMMPETAQRCFANMIFQLGRPTFLKFKRSIELAKLSRWKECSKEILDSRWAKQTPNRAQRISERLATIES